MGNIYTGSNSGKAGLNVKKTDNTVDVFGVSQIQLGNNMTLVNNGNGSVTVNSTGGGGGGGVTELSFGSTGLTPAVATTGSITVAGTLEVGSGGTGLTSLGSANEFLKVNNGATALEYSTGLTYVSTAGSRQLKITDSSTDAMLVLESTDTGTTNAPDLKLFRNKSPPATDDVLGQIKFTALEGNTATEVDYARIEARIDNGGLATYGGSLDFYITNDAAEVRMLTISGEIVGSPNMSFDVNPDGDVDGDFRHFSSGGTVNIFSDSQNRTLDIAPIKNYGFGGTATPLNGELLIGNGSTFSKANLTSTGGSITITNGAGTINLETAVAGYSGWIVQGGGGLTDTVNSGDTLEITGGTGITTTLSGQGGTTPTITIDVDSAVIPSGTGAANQVTYWSGANTITGDSGLTYIDTPGSRQLSVGDEIEIQSTDGGATVAPDLKLYRNSASPAANDVLGQVLFSGQDDAATKINYASITGFAVDVATAQPDGAIVFNCLRNGTSAPYFDIGKLVSGVRAMTVNPNGLDNDFYIQTVNQSEAFFVEGSADTATFNVPVTINQQSNAFSTDFALQLTEDTADPNQSPDFFLYKDSATPTNGDDIGSIQFYGNNAASSGGAKNVKHQYGSIVMDMADVITNQESGRMFLQILKAGTLRQGITIRGDGSGSVVIGDGNAGLGADGLDFRVETTSENEAFTIDTSADTATFNVPLTINGSLNQTTANPLALPPTEGGNIISTTSTVEMAINTGVVVAQEIGLKQTAAAHQVELGKTTTQSFGQTQNLSIAAGPTDCYPSQGGLIVCDDLAGAATQTINLACMVDGGGTFSPNANPPNAAGGGTPPTGVPDKSGYGTWQIGDQVTVLTRFTGGGTPNITILSYAGLDDGAGGSSDPIDTAGPPSQQIPINGVTTGTTITSNYSAKTFILTEDPTVLPQGVSWVAIG